VVEGIILKQSGETDMSRTNQDDMKPWMVQIL